MTFHRNLSLLTVAGVLLLNPVSPPADAQEKLERINVQLPETDDGLPGAGPIRRYDWFKNLWLKRRTEFQLQAPEQQNAVVFLGDSITQGWGPDFRNSFPNLKTANRGISGDTTRGMLIRLQEDVLSLNPKAVVLLMGTNDLEEDASPETIAGNFELIIQALKNHSKEMPIVVCNVFPSSATKKRSAADIREVNERYAEIVRGDDQVTVVDTWTLFANEHGDAKASEFPDLLHPNQQGYDKWAAALRPIFATLKLIERKPEPFEPEAGFRSLFNGQDLTGWGYRPTSDQMRKARARWHERDPNAPPWPIVEEAESFDGKQQTPDGRYQVINGRLVVTTPSEGRKIQQLWTTEEFPQDFVLRLEFRATPNADSGVFIRQPQLQCRDYVLAGPYKELSKYRPQEWNELEITVTGETARCTCNGEVLEEAFKLPATGPIGLEGDRGQIEYRRIRIKSEPR